MPRAERSFWRKPDIAVKVVFALKRFLAFILFCKSAFPIIEYFVRNFVIQAKNVLKLSGHMSKRFLDDIAKELFGKQGVSKCGKGALAPNRSCFEH